MNLFEANAKPINEADAKATPLIKLLEISQEKRSPRKLRL